MRNNGNDHEKVLLSIQALLDMLHIKKVTVFRELCSFSLYSYFGPLTR